jgi:hypothetical protein
MESRDWTAELRQRVQDACCKTVFVDGGLDPSRASVLAATIMADVEVFGVLKAREGYIGGWDDSARSPHAIGTLEAAYPLPPRIRTVLREEPDPHGYAAYYAYDIQAREIIVRHERNGEWIKVTLLPDGFTNMLRPTAERIDLWASLKAEPYRTEEVPADEGNPWPEHGP